MTKIFQTTYNSEILINTNHIVTAKTYDVYADEAELEPTGETYVQIKMITGETISLNCKLHDLLN